MSKIDASKLRILPGRAYPFGAVIRNSGIRFAIVSRHATRVWLDLFENAEDTMPAFEFEFDPAMHRIGDCWSVYIEGLKSGVLYMYRMDGPYDPVQGHRYDPSKFLIDPYARVVVGDAQAGTAKCMVVNEKPDWVDDVRPRVPFSELIIYEMHTRGFTIHKSSGVTDHGTYLGIIEKIPYLKTLGVTAIELLPIQECGERGIGRCSIATRQELTNYWGYNPIALFAPMGKYATKGGGEQLREFRQMVNALHYAGIEIILDVVFNHTAEGNEKGPTLSFRGIDNVVYYMLDEEGRYRNFSGCGNTLNCNHPLVRDFILDCLRYWVTVMHVDGFRFDLASILGRDTKGRIVENAGLVERIAEDPALRDTKLIAEAWDVGGAYQVGSFGDIRWAEWNGCYRDDVRRFWRGDRYLKGAFATRLCGSEDLYRKAGRTPSHSINFITAHDGFTLRDLVSYSRKHNEANGEDNTDGLDANLSWNCGVEGETSDPRITALRLRMQKNFLATLFLSLGTPMVLGGDEFGRTQKGNNNAYCQDNEISWYNWRLLERNQELFRFCEETIQFRKDNPVFRRAEYFEGQAPPGGGHKDIEWFDATGEPPDWNGPGLFIGCRIDGAANAGVSVCLLFNPGFLECECRLPAGTWRVRINTAEPGPEDIQGAETAPIGRGGPFNMASKSLVVLTEAGPIRAELSDLD